MVIPSGMSVVSLGGGEWYPDSKALGDLVCMHIHCTHSQAPVGLPVTLPRELCYKDAGLATMKSSNGKKRFFFYQIRGRCRRRKV